MLKQNNVIEITKIYLVENCYNDPNKVYIGKNKEGSTSRKYPHNKTFGNFIIYTYIDEVNSLKRKDWKPLECYWIEQFRAWGFEVMNKNKGGGGMEFVSNQTKKKMSKPKTSTINMKRSDETKKKLSKPRKIGSGENISKAKIGKPKKGKCIIQFNLNGRYIKEWNSVTKAATYLKVSIGNVSSVLKGNQKTVKGFIFKYK